MMRLFRRALLRNTLYLLPIAAWIVGNAIGIAYLSK